MKIILSSVAEVDIKKLAKKYKNIKSDINGFIKDVKQGSIISDRIQGYSVPVYKARVRNSSADKGKSGGFRVIYHVKIKDVLYILNVYSKNEYSNVERKFIEKSLEQLDIY